VPDAVKLFGASRSRVCAFVKADKDGCLAPKTSWGGWRKLDPELLRKYVAENPGARLEEMADTFNVSTTCVWTALKKLKFR
jgi:Transposase.